MAMALIESVDKALTITPDTIMITCPEGGVNYKAIAEMFNRWRYEFIDERSSQPPNWQLPHFVKSFAVTGIASKCGDMGMTSTMSPSALEL
jgi:hypothetical protein